MKNNIDFLSSTPMGQRVGRYALQREIGRGFSSVVYEATDLLRGRTVALKVLTFLQNLSQERRQDLAERFLREARAISALSHPAIVAIYEIGQAEDGRHFIAMQHLEGETLRARLQREGALAPEVAVPIVLQIAGALEYAHGRGIIHRDVKPDNIFLLPDGTAKLMDFGVAHVLSDEGLTQDGTVVGSPAYMSPEQISGQALDGRTDVFSLGVTLAEMISGRKPFEGPNIPAVMNQILHRPPQIAGIEPRGLRKVLEKALAKNRAARFPGPAAMAEALRPGRAAPLAAPTSTVIMDLPPRRGRGIRSSPAVLGAMSVAATGAAVLFLLSGGFARLHHEVEAATISKAALSRPAPLPKADPRLLGRGGHVHRIAAAWHHSTHMQPHRTRPRPSSSDAGVQIVERPPTEAAKGDRVKGDRETRDQSEPPRTALVPAGPAAPAPPAVPVAAQPARADQAQSVPPPTRPAIRVGAFRQERRPEAAPTVSGTETDREQDQTDDLPPPPRDRDIPDSPPRLLHATDPVYPLSAQERSQQGTVRLRVYINDDGDVTSADVLQSSGVTALDNAAADCVQKWEYDPAFRDGQAVSGTATARVVFRLD